MRALITGIGGQDGAYLTELLHSKGYEVYGIARRGKDLSNLKKLGQSPNIIWGDITETDAVYDVIREIRPNEIYNLAAQSHVGYSFENPLLTTEINYIGLLNIINAVKRVSRQIKIYQASTSELYGYNTGQELDEESPFAPKSPYAVAKLAAHWAGVNARREGIWVSNGILFNHESPLRGEDFVTRKITLGIGSILRGEDFVLELGNLEAKRDWGHAKDYVRAMHLMLQHEKPDDFVIGTGSSYSVSEFLSTALSSAGISYEVEGEREKQVWTSNGKEIVRINSKYYRPNDVKCLIANPLKARCELGWRPMISFDQLVEEMIENDK